MKKILCLVLSLILLLSFSALAEEEREITFQGVPWGSSFEETCQIWLDQGFAKQEYASAYQMLSEDKSLFMSTQGLLIWNYFGEDGSLVVYGQGDTGLILMWHTGNDLAVDKIAGYTVDEVYTFYLYNETEDETALLSTIVTLKVSDEEKASNDLTDKLSTLYGQYRSAHTDGIKDYALWEGANNSAVGLIPGGDRITLFYGTLDAQKMLDAYHAEYPIATPAPVDSTDTSGL